MKGTKVRKIVLLAGLVCIAACAALSQGKEQAGAGMKEQPLYRRLGGYDGIAAVSDDFIQRLATDEQFAKFFAGHAGNSLRRLRQLIVDQLCEATGGPCYYTGRDMKTAHAGLGITEAQWQASVRHLTASMTKFNVPKKEQDELLAIATTLKKDIVEK